ncbi:hypothetical protein [Streptomyces beijiangensis]|uniref:hypothetical protein n=1 Tax=Streptomyces beijiangensis TaxID=163361 RepID=UPI001F5C4987|nr:hypothetical protein [Streptomyces beijiangensis]
MRTRLRAAHILAHQGGHHALLRDGEVVWEDDTLVHVGRGWTETFDEERGRAGLRDAERFLDHAEETGDPLVRGALLPRRIEALSPELLRATAELAPRRDVPVRLHCLQGHLERDPVPHGLLVDRHPSVHGEDRGEGGRRAGRRRPRRGLCRGRHARRRPRAGP